jgi:DNA-binding beta-propeller fold protein YncE
MISSHSPSLRENASPSTGTGELFFLDLSGGRLLRAHADGSGLQVLVEGLTEHPDGIVVDAEGAHIYWSNMGSFPAVGNGSIQRCNLDGSGVRTIVPRGGTYAPKQLKLEKASAKLYWCDREGMRIMRANLDGSNVETLVIAGTGDQDRLDQRRWCVGIAVDTDGKRIYWTQKGPSNAGQGRVLSASLDPPHGCDLANRPDLELLFDALPEPIDLELDLKNQLLYWTDRGDPPRGNTVNRAPLNPAKGELSEILVGGLREGIGLALDFKGKRMFITDLGGSLYQANLDGTGKKTPLSGQGENTGIAYVEL